jgi:selenocysteine lyase/cysteine desulfurase
MSPRGHRAESDRIRPHEAGEFELDPNFIHLNAMLVASPPRRVREAIQRHREGIDRDPAGYLSARMNDKSRIWGEAESLAEVAANYLGMTKYLQENSLTGSSVIAQTTSTTMGLALLANGIKARRGQEVLISIHEFPSWRGAWQLRCERSTLRYREIRLYDAPADVDADEVLRSIERQIRRTTRVLALSWVHSNSGVKLPVRRIGELIRDVNRRRARADRILFCVDGVHGFGVEDVSFEELKCDFLVSGCHKWLFGPRGTGLICALPEAWAQVLPTIPTFLSAETSGTLNTPGGIQAYEYTWALAEAFTFVLEIGKAAIERHTHGLATRLKLGLASIPGVRVVTPLQPELSSGVVCCDVGSNPKEVEEELRNLGVLAMTTTDADNRRYLRFSPSILNDDKQIDIALEKVALAVRRPLAGS